MSTTPEPKEPVGLFGWASRHWNRMPFIAQVILAPVIVIVGIIPAIIIIMALVFWGAINETLKP